MDIWVNWVKWVNWVGWAENGVEADLPMLLGRVPLAHVLVSGQVCEGPLAVRLVVGPVPLIALSVDVLKHAVPFLDIVPPLAVVLVTVGEHVPEGGG